MPRHPLERVNQQGRDGEHQTRLVQQDGVLFTEGEYSSQAANSSTNDFTRLHLRTSERGDANSISGDTTNYSYSVDNQQTEYITSLRGGGKGGKGDKGKKIIQSFKDFIDPDEKWRREIREDLSKLRKDIKTITTEAGAFYNTAIEGIDTFANITGMDITNYRNRINELYGYQAINNEFEAHWGRLLDNGGSLVELASAINAWRPKVDSLTATDQHRKTEQARQWENLQATLAREQRPALESRLTSRVDSLRATHAGLVGRIDTHYESALSDIRSWLATPNVDQYAAADLSGEAQRLHAAQYQQIPGLARNFEADYKRQGKISYSRSDVSVNFDLYSYHSLVGVHEEGVNNLDAAWRHLRARIAQRLSQPQYEDFGNIYDAED
jgi:hypothetical protein